MLGERLVSVGRNAQKTSQSFVLSPFKTGDQMIKLLFKLSTELRGAECSNFDCLHEF